MASSTARVTITRQPPRPILRLRAWQAMPVGGAKMPCLLGQALPSQVGEVRPGGLRVLCTGPGDWLLICSSVDAPSVLHSIEAECRNEGLFAVDLSQGLASFRIEGTAAAQVLSSGCGLDLHGMPGQVARTRLAALPVVIEPLSKRTGFDLYVARSYATYLRDWLNDAAVPF